ncbi:MAG: hypothetical protein HPY73_02645 [Methanomassiliicoccales archaeon]|nr:MAG: hypothetical protein HPY73_02645 [Methanomassiliicoccales archaeon]
MRFKVVRICNSEANTCIPLDDVRFDLDATAIKLKEQGFDVGQKGLMLVARKDGVEYTIYRTGKLLIHPMEKEKAKAAADEFYPLCVKMPLEERGLI